MKKYVLTGLMILLLSTTLAAQTEETAIKAAVVNSYIDPLYKGGSLDAIRDGIPEEFEMYTYIRGELSKRSKAAWLERLEEVRSRPKNPGAPKRVNTHKFAMIDQTGNTAMVKLEIYRDEKLNYTDYLTLYKIDGEWKLLSKFFTWHGE